MPANQTLHVVLFFLSDRMVTSVSVRAGISEHLLISNHDIKRLVKLSTEELGKDISIKLNSLLRACSNGF